MSGPIGIHIVILPPAERQREEVRSDVVRLEDDCRQAAVSEERVARPTNTDRVTVARLVGKSSPLQVLHCALAV
ncbi:hypothetical protein RHGRI_013838 [Rhododendron griersonianum]|uniref:Uncharacterized protein n=1 Tax=Rhododendron griersonianum TaxID=479676 RepID=A0AAV6K7E7_9ERIC|nr:hypothetical protein RHGRI_013838 [Rhododendron griersonianum]